MADDKIVHRISLEGAEDVANKLKKIGDVSSDAFKKVQQSVADSHSGIGKFGDAFAAIAGKTAGGGGNSAASDLGIISRFREAVHALHPVLSEAGIGVGALSSLMYAARGGIVALATAVSGLLITGLERAADQAHDAASKFGAFSGSISKGQQQYGALSETAGKLQTPTSGLVESFEQVSRLNQSQPKESQLPDSGLLEAIGNVVKGAQSERQPVDKVMEAFTKFMSDGREKGFFGRDGFKVLEGIAPRMAAAIEDKLPKGQSSYTGAQVIGAVRAAGPQIDANLIEAQVLPESITSAWEKVKASYEKMEAAAPHGNAVARALDGLASVLNSAAEGREKVKKAAEEAQKAPPQSRHDLASAIHERVVEGGTPPAARESFTAFDAENTGKLTPAAEESAAALDKLGKDDQQKKFDEFHTQGKDAIAAKTTDIGLQQAEIEKRYEPKETASKLEKEQISVQSADIHLEQAKISGTEAQKNLSMAHLAPEEARERVASAESNRDTALSKFMKKRGVDTTMFDAMNAQGADQRELDSAETALKRARIEQKYAGLEEPKAELAAEQSKTAIKSAEIEKSDTTLKLAKDKEGAPLSHELSQLKYADAVLKEEEKNNQFNEEKVKLLDAILQKIGDAGFQKGADGDVRLNENPSNQPLNQPLTAGESKQRVEGFGPGAGELTHPYGVRDITPQTLTPRDITPRDITNDRSEAEQPQLQQVADLGVAAEDAAAKLRGIEAPTAPVATTETSAEGHAGGGHIRGQGSSTSDSIPAMLSDGEYVVKADAVKRLGVDRMDAINNGLAHFADGGEVDPQTGKRKKKHKYHSPFIFTDEDKREADQAGEAYDAWNAAPAIDYGTQVAYGSSVHAKGGLISHFAKGGLVGDRAQHFAKGGVAGNASTFAERICAMGLSTIDVPHLAIGGMPDISPPTLPEDSSVFKNASKGDGPLHPVTLNLPAGGSVDGVFAKPDAVAQLRAAANQAKRFSTGSKPGWYGGVAR